MATDGHIWTIQAALDWTVEYLSSKGDEHPRLSAEWLLSDATGLSRIDLYAYHDKPLTPPERDVLREGVKRRALGEPLQYVSGEVAFRHIVVRVEKDVLIPRPETEMLVEVALEALDSLKPDNAPSRVLDLCTGTGCIALSIAHERSAAKVYATDISPAAVALATRNARSLFLDERVDVTQGDLTAGIDPEAAPFDLVVSNPPYIPSALMGELPDEVSSFEPHLALDGGLDGLDVFRRIAEDARALLIAGGYLVCELHEDALSSAAQFLVQWYEDIEIIDDLAGRKRFIKARYPGDRS